MPDPPAAPSAFTGSNDSGSRAGLSLGFAHYDSSNGSYVAGNKQLFTQTDLVAPGKRRNWKDLILTES